MDESDEVISSITVPELSKLWFEIDARNKNGTSSAAKKMTALMTNERHTKASCDF